MKFHTPSHHHDLNINTYIFLTEHTAKFRRDFRSLLNGLAGSQRDNKEHKNIFTIAHAMWLCMSYSLCNFITTVSGFLLMLQKETFLRYARIYFTSCYQSAESRFNVAPLESEGPSLVCITIIIYSIKFLSFTKCKTK